MSFDQIAAEYSEPLRRYLQASVQDPSAAEDLLQETLLRVDRNLAEFRGDASLKTWLYTIATHVAIDYVRRPERRVRLIPFDDEPELPEAGEATDARLVREEMSDCVRQVIEGLPADYRCALILHDLEGLTVAETAEVVGCSVPTAKIRIHRARHRLKQALDEQCRFYHDERDVHRCDRKPVARQVLGLLVLALPLALAACGSKGPAAPSLPPLATVTETANFRYHFATGDSVDTGWEEIYHAWAIAELGVQIPQKIDYYKYRTREDMGAHTGNYNTNGYAVPEHFELHTLWSTDNHEVVHIYTALIGRPSDFFNEGIAVAFQTNPATSHFEAVFNGVEVHQACRQYLQGGTLVLPLDRVVRTTDFRAIGDSVLSYREAGSFMRFVLDTYGMARTREFFRTSGRDDELATIKGRFQTAFGVSIGAAEAAWMNLLQGSP